MSLTRRDFVLISIGGTAGLALGLVPVHSARRALQPTPFLRIDPHGAITIWVSKSEMGQGVRTALPMIVAEELDARWADVIVKQADCDDVYGEQNTGGSSSVPLLWNVLRSSGASAREMLVAAAAARWSIDRSACRTRDSHVLWPVARKSLRYGELAADAGALDVPTQVRLKTPDEFRIIGRPLARTDGRNIVTGRAKYGLDVRVPGLLRAAMIRSPIAGGRLTRIDAGALASMPAVKLVLFPGNADAAAVVAPSAWDALQARTLVRAEWDRVPDRELSSDTMRVRLREAARGAGQSVRSDISSATQPPVRTITAQYELPLLAHGTMEPMNCVADVREGECEIWAPCQFPTAARAMVAEQLAIPVDRVQIHIPLLGGGFGRRINSDYILEAVRVSREVGKPIQVVWSREDDFRFDFFRPMTLHQLEGGLTAAGEAVSWRHKITGAPIGGPIDGPLTPYQVAETWGARDLPYDIAAVEVEYRKTELPGRRGWWRGVSRTQNIFAVESFIDELAVAAGRDPVQFRLAMLATDRKLTVADTFSPDMLEVDRSRLARVVREAARAAGWESRLQTGSGRGIACVCDCNAGTYVAEVVECSVTSGGALVVNRVVCAMDCGVVINPDLVRSQVQGGIAMGLSAALLEEVRIDGGTVANTSFRDYPVLRLRHMPRVETILIASTEPPGGVGEPPLPAVAPALTNAIYRATHRRIRSLPLTRHFAIA